MACSRLHIRRWRAGPVCILNAWMTIGPPLSGGSDPSRERDIRTIEPSPAFLESRSGYLEHDILAVNEDGAENITGFPSGPEQNVIQAQGQRVLGSIRIKTRRPVAARQTSGDPIRSESAQRARAVTKPTISISARFISLSAKMASAAIARSPHSFARSVVRSSARCASRSRRASSRSPSRWS